MNKILDNLIDCLLNKNFFKVLNKIFEIKYSKSKNYTFLLYFYSYYINVSTHTPNKQAKRAERLRYKNVYQCCNDSVYQNKNIVTKLGRLPNNGFPMLPDVISLMVIEYVHCRVIDTRLATINEMSRKYYKTTCSCRFENKREKSKLILK